MTRKVEEKIILAPEDVATPQGIYAKLSTLRREEMHRRAHEREKSNDFWVYFEEMYLIEETAWLDKEQATVMLREALAAIYENKKTNPNNEDMGSHGKIQLFRWFHRMDLLQSQDIEKLREEWSKAIAQIEDPLEKLYEELDFAGTFETEENQRELATATTKELFNHLPSPNDAPSFFDEHEMRHTAWILYTVNDLKLTAEAQRILDYIENLHSAGIVHTMKPYVVRTTLSILESNIPLNRVEQYVEEIAAREKQQVKNAFLAIIQDATDGASTFQEEDVPDEIQPVIGSEYDIWDSKVLSDGGIYKRVGICPWLEGQGIQVAKRPAEQTLSHFGEVAKRHDTLIERICDFYLDHQKLDAAIKLWTSLVSRHALYWTLYDLQNYALKRQDLDLLKRVEGMYYTRQERHYREEAKTGHMLYVSRILRDGEVASIFLINQVKKAIEDHSTVLYEFIQKAMKLPEDHPARKLANKVLRKKLTAASKGEVYRGEMDNLLRTVLMFQTGAHRRVE
jgi:hypothetical protein